MVSDNANNTSDFFKTRADQDDGTEPPNNDCLQKKLGHYIPKCNHGSILVTTRNKEAAVKFADTVEGELGVAGFLVNFF
jgi:hypothetical protein